MRLACWITLCVVWRSGDAVNLVAQESIDEFTESEDNRSLSSCKWEDPPENGLNFRPCAVGICLGTRGSYSKNGTRRITRCDPHYILINGQENDVCENGVWSSKGHECVQCGKSPRKFDALETAALIVNGYNSSRGDFPWMAALFMPQDAGRWTQICAGTLISPDIVLTAAHCLNINGRILKPEEIKVGLGRLSVDFYNNEPGSIVSSAKQLIIPERFVGVNRLYDLDIGLIVLEKRVPIDDHIMPACLDWEGVKQPKHNENGVLAGWGLTDVGGSRSETLKWTYQKYTGYQECLAMMTGTDQRFFSPDKFCTDEVKGGKAESGDSGGGLTFERDGYHYVYGIVSTKMLTSVKQLRLFTNVMNEIHLAWLTDKWRRLKTQLPRDNNVIKPSTGGSDKVVVCYFMDYAWYRKSPANFRPENINASLCTHINYGFAVLDQKDLTIAPLDRWADIDNKFFELVTSYRRTGLKVLISIGGWTNSNPDHWSRMMSSSSSRRKFINSVLSFLEAHNFDGLDVAYFYPACPQANIANSQKDDKANFNLLMSELKISFGGKFLLSMTAAAPESLIRDCYDMAPLCGISDWVNIVSYDYHTHSHGYTGPSAPVRGNSSNWGVYETLDYYRHTLKCPSNKLVLGVPFFGQTYTLADPSNPRFGVTSTGPGVAGPYTQSAGILSYMEICENIKNGYKVRNDLNDNTYAWKDAQFISFDGVGAMESKMNLTNKLLDLRGAMVWTLDFDDFNNVCGCGSFPLLRALNHHLGRTDTGANCY